MNISSIGDLANYSKYAVGSTNASENKGSAFGDVLQAAVNGLSQTNNYSNAASEAETAYSLGQNDNVADLMVAEQKANVSLQYTVAIRNSVMDAYKEIMNLQF
jgi:flagellar hook-basal body complex protein FliE